MLKSWTQSDSPRPEKEIARLNLFQRLVRQWELLHPYNSVHALKLSGRADFASVCGAWHDALEALGLGSVCLNENLYHYQCLNGQATDHGVVRCPPGTLLVDWITQEMNRPFQSGGGVPFRPFLIQETEHYWLGVCYQHWVADAVSILLLTREWFVRQFDPAAACSRALRTKTPGYLTLFGPHHGGWHAGQALLSSLRWHSQFRRVRRIEDAAAFRDLSVRFSILDTEEGLIERLRTAARAAGVTVNDLFLAALAEACDRYVPAPRRFRRQDLAVGTIVDLRRSAGRSLDDVFNLLLGFSSVCCRTGHFTDWPTLLSAIARQTHRQKKGGQPQASWMRMMAGLVIGKYLSREETVNFYRKRASLAGANSNVNLNRYWPVKYWPSPLLAYLRAPPTGPMTPLVATTTTLGSDLSVTLTYRPAIVPPQKANRLGKMFVARLASVAGETPPPRNF